jgi:hypothetical protein
MTVSIQHSAFSQTEIQARRHGRRARFLPRINANQHELEKAKNQQKKKLKDQALLRRAFAGILFLNLRATIDLNCRSRLIRVHSRKFVAKTLLL